MLTADTERFKITTNTGRHIILFASDKDMALERFKNEYRDKQTKGESVDSLEQLKWRPKKSNLTAGRGR
jgi:hypothetical protein